jgi:hypothetical protein
VSESTLEAAAVPEPKVPELPPQRRARIPAPIRRHPWWIGSACLVVCSFLLIRWAGTRPGYDPYGWMIWGYQTLHLNLDLGGAPSWKPLTWLFDVPFALFGRGALWLWMTTSVSIALAGSIFAGRVSYHLSRMAGVEHNYALVGGVFAGLCLLGIEDYFHYLLSVQSDPMIVTFCLAAIDCHLCGRYKWALALGVLASLGRPEAWPWVGLYGIWLWRKFPSMRWLVAAELLVIPALWFGVPTITNGRPFVAGQLALLSPRELHQNKIIGTLHRFTALMYLPVQLLSLVTIGVAAMRRSWLPLILAGGAVGWLVVELAFVLHGWPGVPRYLFEPAGVMIVLAGVAIGLILQEVPKLGRYRVPSWAGMLVVGLIVASLVPGAIARARKEHKDLKHERVRTAVIGRLSDTINAVGGWQRIRDCGHPVTTVQYVSILAWYTHLNDGVVGHRPKFELKQKTPSVFFEPLHSGWTVLPWHIVPNKNAACASLKRSFIYSRHHPHGVLAHYIPAPFN